MPMSPPIPLKSSNLRSVSYDPDTKTLEVEFTNGNRYQYADVARATVDALIAAPSAGTFFHQHVRGAFKASKL